MGAQTAGPKWKREKVQDHKFDFVDVDEFHDPSCLTRTKYMLLFLVVLKSVLVYAADMWTAVSLLVVGSTTTLAEIDIGISIDVSKYIFLGAILISFLLLFWDIRKGRTIVASRDISYTFTSVFASRYYSLKDYNYYCFFCKIQNSKKTTDEIAFFVFFTLKGWKRLLLAEAPRQVINAVTLYALLKQWIDNNHSLELQSLLNSMSKDVIAKMMTYTMAFSFVIFVISFFMICVAAILYIPLLCHIQGNLKEYCCHKVDKRISELLKKQVKKRQAKGGQARHGKGIKENIPLTNMGKPTLPVVDHFQEEKLIHGSPYHSLPRTPYSDPHFGGMTPPLARRGSNSSMGSDLTGFSHGRWQQSPLPRYHSPVPTHASASPYMGHYQANDTYADADHTALLQHAQEPFGRRPSGESAAGSENNYYAARHDYYRPQAPRNPGDFLPPPPRSDSPVYSSPRTSPAHVHQTPTRYQNQTPYYPQTNYRGY
ncbi:unnamed protein product [Umbelopsis ramanniana]